MRMEKMLTTKEVCNIIGLSERTLNRHARNKSIKAHKIGRTWMFRPCDIEEYLNRAGK